MTAPRTALGSPSPDEPVEASAIPRTAAPGTYRIAVEPIGCRWADLRMMSGRLRVVTNR